jgi:2-keto-3-deoxy-L-rhamnonate aldolase RhmA
MRTNTAKAKLAEGKAVFGAIITGFSTDLVELFGAIGFDFVMIERTRRDVSGSGGAHGESGGGV